MLWQDGWLFCWNLLGRRKQDISLKDTFDFIDSVKELNMRGRRMLSFDVTALFTKAAIMETVGYLCDYIENNGQVTYLPIVDLK